MRVFEQYWPILALALWFGYKWWAAKQVVRRLPELRQNGAVFVDVQPEQPQGLCVRVVWSADVAVDPLHQISS